MDPVGQTEDCREQRKNPHLKQLAQRTRRSLRTKQQVGLSFWQTAGFASILQLSHLPVQGSRDTWQLREKASSVGLNYLYMILGCCVAHGKGTKGRSVQDI